MKLELRYFASLRERLGTEGEAVELPEQQARVADLRDWLAQRGEPWESAMNGERPVLAAVNEEMAGEQRELADGDRVAFFPPVTGG